MLIRWVTLDVGEQALVYDVKGQGRIEEGPKRLFLWREKLTRLRPFAANQNEYLIVRLRNGLVQHIPGPSVLFLNPLIHEDIQVHPAISLDANEVLVVYNLDPETHKVTRYLRNGPTLFIPQANEWLHKFLWHGTDPQNKTRMIEGSHVFTRLQVIPDQFYYNVDEVRTADDALMRVKLMIFYEVKDINHMLNTTQDPIADFINCVSADVVAFVSKLSYTEFIERSAELNDLTNYPLLKDRCRMIGYEVSKVVFRGYYASEQLQRMHDGAIEARVKLKLDFESEEQTESLIDMNIKNDQERAALEQRLELDELSHRQSIERCEHEHNVALMKQQHVEAMCRRQKQQQARLVLKQLVDEQRTVFYDHLFTLGVDLTTFLLSHHPQPAQVIRVVGDGAATNLHVHHN